ncbi:hypothetical protein SAMN04488524_0599 [Pedobacter africanus]|uniref:Uncharacterized protein n=1 Tax=Pedobacter africanus TaxID=151894 RepID=A0A1W1ZCR2_9SPHI|nr:hypothetical protein SAMN04488524_0599 [Pedobacter africanus]
MEFNKKLYKVRHSSGGLTTELYTKQEAMQIISQQGGEIVSVEKGWGGCMPTVIVVVVALALITWWLCS